MFIGLTALELTACGATTPTIKPHGAAKPVSNVVSRQTGFHPTDVSCPSGVESEGGRGIRLPFHRPDGPYTAHMKITKVNGDDVEFFVQSRPTNK